VIAEKDRRNAGANGTGTETKRDAGSKKRRAEVKGIL
jgi:hypothetical protein